MEKIKNKLEKDKKEYAETLISVKGLLQDKQTVELNAWAENEKSKRTVQLESDFPNLPNQSVPPWISLPKLRHEHI
jgi:hypothetical protein